MKVTHQIELDSDYYLNVLSDAVANLVKGHGCYTVKQYQQLLIKICEIYNDKCYINSTRGMCVQDVKLEIGFGGRHTTYNLVII